MNAINLLTITDNKIIHVANALEHSHDPRVKASLEKEKEYLLEIVPLILKELSKELKVDE